MCISWCQLLDLAALALQLFQSSRGPYHISAMRIPTLCVMAGKDLQRSAFGAGFPLFANAMYKKLGIDWASSLLGFLGIAFIPIPFALHKWGRQVRFKGKLARKDI